MVVEISRQNLSGEIRTNAAFLKPVGDAIRRQLAHRVPASIETSHLTLLTIPFALVVLLGGYLARENVHWLWLVSLVILIQYVTDVLDGEIGRIRQTGLVRWGFYMDHFGDFVFGSAVIGSYMLLFPNLFPVLVGLLVVTTGFYLHEALTCICTGEYNVYGYHGIGWEETRLLVILGNALIALVRPAWIDWVFVGALLFFAFGLAQQIYRTQRLLWQRDIADRSSAV